MGIFGTSQAEALAQGALTQGSLGQSLATFGGMPFQPGVPLPAATGILGGVSLGSLAGGVLGGFGLGSVFGGLTQSAFGKVGPGPRIGAGVGAAAGAAIGSIVPGIGTCIGGIIGGPA